MNCQRRNGEPALRKSVQRGGGCETLLRALSMLAAQSVAHLQQTLK